MHMEPCDLQSVTNDRAVLPERGAGLEPDTLDVVMHAVLITLFIFLYFIFSHI